ncbi:MAG: hypothetical protein ACRYFU_23085 [Janthinobacterium lividum]
MLDAAAAGNLEELSQIHAVLSDLIAPATPRAIVLMHEEKARHPRLVAFGPVPIVRQLLLVASLSLVSMLLVALSPHINPDSMQHDLPEGEGVNLLVCEIFLVSASAVGSSFAALFKENRYITQGTYDPRYSSSYWTQLSFGIIAGVVLSKIIFHTMEGGSGSTAHRAFDQPILALMGGFSASLVYRIFNRILTAIKSLFGTDPKAEDAFANLQNRRLRQTLARRAAVGESGPFVSGDGPAGMPQKQSVTPLCAPVLPGFLSLLPRKQRNVPVLPKVFRGPLCPSF